MTHVSDTFPYPWPYDGAVTCNGEPERLAVVVCGAQRHWIAMIDAEGQRIDVDEGVDDILGLVDELRAVGALVVWIRTGRSTAGRRPIDRTLPVVGSDDWALVADPFPGDVVVDTPAHDGFAVAWLDVELRGRGIDRLAMVGIGTESVVSATNRNANDRGYECLTVTDAVIHHHGDTGAAALSSICMSGGIFGALGTGGPLLAALAAE